MSPVLPKARYSHVLNKCLELSTRRATINNTTVVSRAVASNAKRLDGQPSSRVKQKNLMRRSLASDCFSTTTAYVRRADIPSIIRPVKEILNVNLHWCPVHIHVQASRHQQCRKAAKEIARHKSSNAVNDVVRETADEDEMRTSYTTAAPGDSNRSEFEGADTMGVGDDVCVDGDGDDGHWRVTRGFPERKVSPFLSWSSSSKEEVVGRQGEAHTCAVTLGPLVSVM